MAMPPPPPPPGITLPPGTTFHPQAVPGIIVASPQGINSSHTLIHTHRIGIPIANPPRPPAAGEVLLGYYYIQDTVYYSTPTIYRLQPSFQPRPIPTQAGCFQCADLNFAGCCICTFFALWLVTWPLAMMVCLLPPFHTGMQFPVYGYPPPTADANAWQQGPPQQFQYPPTWTPPPPDPNMRPPQGVGGGLLVVLHPSCVLNGTNFVCERMHTCVALLSYTSIHHHCTGFQSGNLPPSISSKNLNPPVAEGIPVGTAGGAGGTAPTTTEAPAAQKM